MITGFLDPLMANPTPRTPRPRGRHRLDVAPHLADYYTHTAAHLIAREGVTRRRGVK